MNTTYLLLGSNEGDRKVWLQKAISLIAEKCGAIVKRSSIYQTAAWGITEQPDFLNMVLEVETNLGPEDLLQSILEIETAMGRHRTVKWGPRIIDIDILFYNKLTLSNPELVIPHPFLQDRRFTLMPLAELAPDYIHPVFAKSVSTLLSECKDTLVATRLEEAI